MSALPVLRDYSVEARGHISRIREYTLGTVLSIMEIGKGCERFAKENRGEYTKACNEGVLGFSVRTADMFRTVASTLGIGTIGSDRLPPSWRTLYELTKLGQVEIVKRIKSKDITPDLTRAQAVALRKPKKKGPSVSVSPLAKVRRAILALTEGERAKLKKWFDQLL